MKKLRKFIRNKMPGLASRYRLLRQSFLEWRDRFFFPAWLIFQCLSHRKKAIVVWRTAAMGDIVCTLPLCAEIRKQHPQALLVFITERLFQAVPELCPAVDCVYGIRHRYGTPSWIGAASKLCLGLIEKIHEPLTTDERSPGTGVKVHLIDDLASSCGVVLSNRQPKLVSSPELMRRTQSAYGLTEAITQERLIIGINGGHTWPVREWDVEKWQKVVNAIHAEYDALILQFGFPLPPGVPDPYTQLHGVQSLVGSRPSEELVALIASCNLIVSIDSGPIHVAGAVGVPSIGLFGAVNPLYRLPPETPAAAIFSEVPCLFCHHQSPIGHWKTGCAYDIRCMKELEVQPVFEAIKLMLPAKQPPAARAGG